MLYYSFLVLGSYCIYLNLKSIYFFCFGVYSKAGKESSLLFCLRTPPPQKKKEKISSGRLPQKTLHYPYQEDFQFLAAFFSK